MENYINDYNNSREDASYLLKIIDDRIRKYMKKDSEFFGIVTEVLNNGLKAKVKFINEEFEFTLLNKTNEILSINDSVVVKAINGNLTNGYISLKFGTSNISSEFSSLSNETSEEYVKKEEFNILLTEIEILKNEIKMLK